MDTNLYAHFRSRFPDPGTPCIQVPGGATYSYGDVDGITARYAGVLKALGLEKGDRVAVQAEKSPQAIFLYLACLRAGVIFLPINTAYREAETEYLLGDATPGAVVVAPDAEAGARVLAKRVGVEHVLTLGQDDNGSLPEQALTVAPAHDIVAVDAGSDGATILYTSGTTGRPKGAVLTHRNLGTNAEALHRVWQFRRDDVLLHALPIFHAHGLFVATNTQLLNGGRMIWLDRFDPERVVDLLPEATVFMGVPTYYVRLLGSARLAPDLCRGMRLFVSGSAPLLEETFHAFAERTGHTIVERYGMTETVMNTSNPVGGQRAGSVGPALPGVEVRVADENGRVLGAGEIGVIEVRGPNVFAGYWRNPEKTRSEFRDDGFFITGDVGRIDGDGYVWIMGRAKDLIISGGFNVYPKEIELLIDSLPGIGESAVIGVPHPDFGEGVTAVVTRSGDGRSTDETGVIGALKDQLAGFKVPKRVFFVDELPRNTMGKVQKNLLRERYSETYRS
jgi:malonyl-CoA/methylmalonyl-CoA synthetase